MGLRILEKVAGKKAHGRRKTLQQVAEKCISWEVGAWQGLKPTAHPKALTRR
jgi:hypothetical protein